MLDDVDIEGDDSAEEEGGSWYSRASGGVRSLGSGALFLGALVLLFWNEGYSKRHGDALQELASQVLPAATANLDPLLEGKPVHLSALVTSQAGAKDSVFGIGTDGVALYRHVEMFQWIEYEESTGRGRKKKTTYSYEQDWDSEYHDSSQFHEPAGHENPKPALTSDGFFAADARFGPYRFDNVDVTQQALDDLYDPQAPGSLGNWPKMVEALPDLSSALTAKRWYQLEPGVYYRGSQTSDVAELGDLSVSFYSFANNYSLTMVGAQRGEHLEPWRASNGDTILLAAGGVSSADELVKQAEAQSAGLTHLLRIVGLAGAVIGGAGIASWMGGFLTMIPVVGRLVDMSLMVAGGLFGLMAGLLTVVIGWLAARPWIAAVLLIAIGSAVTWAIQKRRAADGQSKRAQRAGKLAATARQRAAEALQSAATAAAPSGWVAAGAGGMPPPPPSPPSGAARFTASDPRMPPTAPPPLPPSSSALVVDESKDLAPLEWTPGLIATKPPSVRPNATAPPRPPEPSAPPPAAPPVARASGQSETRRLTPVPVPVPPTPEPTISSLPGFDMVQPREAVRPLFDDLPTRESAAPLFDTVPMREREAPPVFDLLPSEPAPPLPIAAPAPQPAPVQRLATTPDASAAKTIRVALGSKGTFQLNKLVRQHADGRQETLCFELTQGGKPIKRGTQDEVKEALRLALTGGG